MTLVGILEPESYRQHGKLRVNRPATPVSTASSPSKAAISAGGTLGQVIEFQAREPDRYQGAIVSGTTQMLAEKFFLALETVISRTYSDGSPRVVSTSPHVPIKLPSERAK